MHKPPRTPSVFSLSAVFGDKAKQARNVLRMSRADLENTDAGRARIATCHNAPDTADIRMHVLNALDDSFHGVEAIAMGGHGFADYLNTGDTYAATVIYWDGRYRVQSVGDFVEIMERRGIKAD